MPQPRPTPEPDHRTTTRPVAGLDGCPDGWVVVVDSPIGLTAAGQRTCDRAARATLGRPRGSSVFSAPVRSVLGVRDLESPRFCGPEEFRCPSHA